MNTRHFKQSEFQCKCCKKSKPCLELMVVLELVRAHFKKPVIITSGYRCLKNNKRVGGAPGNKHLKGIAADIKINGVTPSDIYDFLNDTFPDNFGIGLYSGWVHIDVRKTKARW